MIKNKLIIFIFTVITSYFAFSQESNIPEKWQNESAVYLKKKLHYTYNRPHNSIEFNKVIHERVKLQDQAAVTQFSEFKYKKDDSYISYGMSRVTTTHDLKVKIIKPDGTEIEVDTKEILEGDEEKKIAIPNLEKGDVIDYLFETNVILGENDLYHYQPVEILVKSEYPILDYEFILDTEKDFFVTINSYNGAPKLEDTSPYIKKKKDKKRVYSFKSYNIDKNKSNRWFYPFAELPSIKFQVNFARTGKYEKRAYAFIPKESDSLKRSIKKEDVFNFYKDKFEPYGKLKGVDRFLKDKSYTTNEEKVKAVFYFMRHEFFTNYIEAFIADEADLIYPYEYYDKNPIFFKEEEEFIKYFAAFLKDSKIDYEILIGTKRYNGGITNLLLESNIDFLLKVKTTPVIYIEDFDHLATVNLIDPLLESSNAYALKVTNLKKVDDIETVLLPTTTYKENNTTKELIVNIPDDFSSFNVIMSSSYLGHNKLSEQKDRLNFYDYIYEDYKKYNNKSIAEKIRSKKQKAKYINELAALQNKLKDKQKERFEYQTKGEFDFDFDTYSFEIIKNGRFGKSETFELSETFTVPEDLLSKAGKNYILQVGKLIGGQVEIDENEKERENNIYMRHARSFTDQITINIPEGYTVGGLEKLNVNISNETGGFISTGNIEGGTVKISTIKYYTNNYEPIDNWSKMITFLDAAYQFTQEKILFKKM